MGVPGRYTIGELARGVGVPASTLRFYERRGLVVPGARSRSNYRLYDDDALRRLAFIRAAQDAGFTLADIRALFDFKDGATPPCREVQDLLRLRLEALAGQIEHLQQVRATLHRCMRVCRSAERSGRCGVLEFLDRRARRTGTRRQAKDG